MLGFAKKFIGSSNDRKVKGFMAQVQKINALEDKFAALSDGELRMMTDAFRDRLAKGETLDKLLNEAFAVVREASKRVLGQRQYDVQLTGGMILHEGGIAEMRTGEGKTLVAVAPVYLNALAGKGVHVITVNDYLAKRDAEWMGRVYRFLGMEVGVIVNGLSGGQRQAAYAADITYGTNNEFGFDYLRDNLVYDRREMVQRGHHFVIVDEVDSILIDEARTPLIISGPTEDRSDLYVTLDGIIKELIKEPSYFEVDEKQRQVLLTEEGSEAIEAILEERGLFAEDTTGLYDAANISLVHHANQALRANTLYQRDKDYIIRSEEVMLIDEFTGRMMQGRRLSEGLHQALEAKEGVKIQPENQTLASVTIQNYFRLYSKLSGMTGTAATEAQEFLDIYKMDVMEIPTNRPIKRIDYDDEVYRTSREKNEAIAKLIAERHLAGQPILVGTVSIEKSETLSKLLQTYEYQVEVDRTLKAEFKGREKEAQKAGDAAYDIRYETRLKGIPHSVLNARQHEQEAFIVAEAGLPGAVTIATNMAGRGTDIQLGGNLEMRLQRWRQDQRNMGVEVTPESEAAQEAQFKTEIAEQRAIALEAGGLFVLGTERHESRRIDNQLRGRSGRQGDPGSSRFYLSFADDLMRVFGSERIAKLMEMKWFQWEEGMPIEHRMVTRAIESAQRRIEGQNFDYRKALIEYDNTMNRQREVIYEQRRRILEGVDLRGLVHSVIDEVTDHLVESCAPKELRPDAWDVKGLRESMGRQFGVVISEQTLAIDGSRGDARDAMREQLVEAFRQAYEAKGTAIGPEAMPHLERAVLLQVMDAKWKDHLYMMDALREDIQLHRYGQRNPVVEYQHKAYPMFRDMIESVKMDSLALLLRVKPVAAGRPASVSAETPRQEVRPDAPTVRETATRQQAATGGGVEGPGPMPQPASAPAPPPFGGPAKPPSATVHRAGPKIGRNDPCHCGSGKKFKKCHGR